jgi:hypothetical protein
MKIAARFALSALMLGALALPATAAAQERPADFERELRELATTPNAADADRALVLDFVTSEQVRDVARSIGVDGDRLADHVQTLDNAQAGDLAKRLRDANEHPLAGGDRVVITTTTIIIVLLIIILVAVA